MKIILIYSVLATFFIDQVIGPIGFSRFIRGFSLFNLNIYLLLFIWVATVIIQRRRIFLTNNVNIYIVLMGFVVLISIFIKIIRGEIPNLSIIREVLNFKGWLNPVLLFFILFNIVDDEEICNQVLIGLSFLFIALILAQLSATFGITGYKEDIFAKHGRAGGFGAAGEYAITLALIFPLVLSESFFIRRRGLYKIFSILLGFLILVGLINAGSRNGIVSFLFSVLVYLLFLKRKKIIGTQIILLLIIAIIVGGATAFVASPHSVTVGVSKRFDPSNYETVRGYTSGRTELWKNGLKLFIDSPLIGHGRNSFVELSVLRGYRHIGSAHNEYLNHLSEYGFIGLVLYLLIFYKIFKNIWRSLQQTTNPQRIQLYASYLAGLCAYIVGLFVTNAGPSLFIFWIYTAIIYKYAELDLEKNV